MPTLANGQYIDDEDLLTAQKEIVHVLSQHTHDLQIARLIISTLNLDDYAVLKEA
jgi:hypothetical protein